MLNIACVQVSNYEGRGSEYVNKLALMCQRNITLPYKFVCVTDEPGGYLSDVHPIPAPKLPHMRGWFAKLYLFAPGVFPKGERVLFFDLDTLILADIDDYASYVGPLAGLGDFRTHRLFASGLMAWEAGTADRIWTNWVKQGYPIGDGTDDSWIVSQVPEAVRIQRKLSGIVSYKFHKCQKAPPEGARICVFQRKPKPHECGGWVKDVWR